MDNRDNNCMETPGTDDSWRAKMHYSVQKKKRDNSQRNSTVISHRNTINSI